jgi:hypothetical protein
LITYMRSTDAGCCSDAHALNSMKIRSYAGLASPGLRN